VRYTWIGLCRWLKNTSARGIRRSRNCSQSRSSFSLAILATCLAISGREKSPSMTFSRRCVTGGAALRPVRPQEAGRPRHGRRFVSLQERHSSKVVSAAPERPPMAHFLHDGSGTGAMGAPVELGRKTDRLAAYLSRTLPDCSFFSRSRPQVGEGDGRRS